MAHDPTTRCKRLRIWLPNDQVNDANDHQQGSSFAKNPPHGIKNAVPNDANDQNDEIRINTIECTNGTGKPSPEPTDTTYALVLEGRARRTDDPETVSNLRGEARRIRAAAKKSKGVTS